MRKLVLELLTLVLLVFATWFALSRINWMGVLRVEQVTAKMEEKIGDLCWESMKRSETEIHDGIPLSQLDTLLGILCEKNHIDRSRIHFHLIRKDDVNAFALPNNHVVVYSGLVDACENEAEFSGVLCHELAHIEKGHIMHKLVKEAGLSVLISMSTGKGSSQTIREVLKHLSSTAYDRELESEADTVAVAYLIKAAIDPAPFANFLYRLSEKDNLPHQLYWISTHPDSRERSERITRYIQHKTLRNITILGDVKWGLLKKAL